MCGTQKIKKYMCAQKWNVYSLCVARNWTWTNGVWCKKDTVMCETLEKHLQVKTENVIPGFESYLHTLPLAPPQHWILMLAFQCFVL